MNYNVHALLFAFMALHNKYVSIHTDCIIPIVTPTSPQPTKVYALASWIADQSDENLSSLMTAMPTPFHSELADKEAINGFRQALIALVEIGFPRYPISSIKFTYTRRHFCELSSVAFRDLLALNDKDFSGKTFAEWIDDSQPLQERQSALLKAYCSITSAGGNT